MRLAPRLAGLALVGALSGPASAQPVDIQINPVSSLTKRYYTSISSIGWYFTPSSSFFLTAINTRFSAFGTNLNRTVMVELWSDRPAAGGSLLRNAGFQSNTAIGGFGGGSFASFLLQSGIQYFIGFRNVQGLGWNSTSDPNATSLGSPWASVGPVFSDDTFESAGGGSEVVRNPSLELIGSAVPEPATMTLLATGLLAMGGVTYVRRRRAAKQEQEVENDPQ